MIGFIALIHSTRNYKWFRDIADLHTSQFTVTHTLGFSVFTSRILATDFSLTVAAAQTKSFHSQISFLESLLNHLRLPSQETPSVLLSADLGSSLYGFREAPAKTPFPNNSFIVIEVCLPRRCVETSVFLLLRACSFRANLFPESMPRNERLLWLRYSGFLASCHSILK
jgi:hypothetical protein